MKSKMVGKKHVHPKKYRKIGKNRRKHPFLGERLDFVCGIWYEWCRWCLLSWRTENKTDRGAETISNPLEEMRDGKKGWKGNPPKFGSRSDGSGAGTQQNMRRTVTFVERYQKSKPLPGVCCSCEKKRSLCARATGFFYCLRKLFLPLWVTQGAQS